MEHDERAVTSNFWPRVSLLTAALMVCVALALALAPSRAEAGHYYIRDLGVVSLDRVIKLRDSGIQTTEHFLAASLTPAARAEVAKKTGMAEADVLKFALTCELLQINGIGPKVVTLMQATGVVDLADLAKRDPPDLTARMAAVNKVERITGVDPPTELVASWVAAAAKAKYRVTR